MLGQPFGKQQVGNPYRQSLAIIREQARGFEPGMKAVSADFRLDPTKNLIPYRRGGHALNHVGTGQIPTFALREAAPGRHLQPTAAGNAYLTAT
jgi:hypothetical protein